VTVGLSASGTLALEYWADPGKTASVIFDVTGYFVQGPSGMTFHAVVPFRAYDSRKVTGGRLKSQAEGWAPIVSRPTAPSPVPASASAVAGIVTDVNPTQAGYITVAMLLPGGTTPGTSTVNFPAGVVRANGFTLQLSTTGGTLDILYQADPGNWTDVIIDITGYFS
jgi:hypothetical protein